MTDHLRRWMRDTADLDAVQITRTVARRTTAPCEPCGTTTLEAGQTVEVLEVDGATVRVEAGGVVCRVYARQLV